MTRGVERKNSKSLNYRLFDREINTSIIFGTTFLLLGNLNEKFVYGLTRCILSLHVFAE